MLKFIAINYLQRNKHASVGTHADPWSRPRHLIWSHIITEWNIDYHLSGPGWTASFEDDFSCRDFASIAMDTGSNVWGSSTAQLSETEEKGWATFTDFQPFCWWGRDCVLVDIVYSGHVDTVLNVLVFCSSDTGPRCSSPVDSENPNKQSQNEESKCVHVIFFASFLLILMNNKYLNLCNVLCKWTLNFYKHCASFA